MARHRREAGVGELVVRSTFGSHTLAGGLGKDGQTLRLFDLVDTSKWPSAHRPGEDRIDRPLAH